MVDLDAEMAGGQVGLVHGCGGALGEGLGILRHMTSSGSTVPVQDRD
jgi:hypothetical protein